ncbi:MAG: hypothetical protein ACKOPG_07910 [Novosphingobium sp.]
MRVVANDCREAEATALVSPRQSGIRVGEVQDEVTRPLGEGSARYDGSRE